MKLPDPKNFKLKAPPVIPGSIVAYAALDDKKVLKQMKKEIDRLNHSLETFKHREYREECLKIAPLWLFKEASTKALELFRKMTVWDEKNKTIIILIFNYEGKLISLKRRRFIGGKWVAQKGTHPNRQCIMRIKNKYLPVFIIEGHHDALSAMLLDIDDINTFNFIMIPTASYREFNETELEALAGRDIYFLPDLGDKDSGSIRGMTKLAKQTEEAGAANVRVVNLKNFLEENGIDVPGEKLDLSEAIFLWREGSVTFINLLLYYCDRGIVFDGEIF